MDRTDLCFPNSNRSCRVPRPDADQERLHSLVLGGIAALVTGLNLLVILSIACFRQLQTPTHRILLSLAASDFLVGLVFLPIMVRTTGVCWVWGDAACVLYFYFGKTLVQASVGSMVLISVDRYIAVADPMRYQSHMSTCKVNLSICIAWTYALLRFLIVNYGFYPDKPLSCLGLCQVSSAVEANILLSWVIPFGIIVILYIQIFRVVILKTKATRSKQSIFQVKQRSELKAARNLGSVLVCYVVCYSPFLITGLSGDKVDASSVGSMASALIAFLNSAVNPVIYTLIYPQFRKAFRAIFTLSFVRVSRARSAVSANTVFSELYRSVCCSGAAVTTGRRPPRAASTWICDQTQKVGT